MPIRLPLVLTIGASALRLTIMQQPYFNCPSIPLLYPIVTMRPSGLLLAFVALVSAQNSNLTTCCDVSPATVDPNQRLSWCRAQRNTCPELCKNGQTTANDCNQVCYLAPPLAHC